MTQINKPFLESGQIIPAFTLPSADGMPHSPWDYKQREHLLLLFLQRTSSNETRGLLRAFSKAYPVIREEQCSILAITPDTVVSNLQAHEELGLPYPLLADPKGEVLSQYTLWDTSTSRLHPSIVLADRYNALYQQWVTENEVDLPTIEELLNALTYLNKLCTP